MAACVVGAIINIAQLGYGNTDTIGDDEDPVSAGDVDVGAAVSKLWGDL